MKIVVCGRVEPPKTKYGRREVALPASLPTGCADTWLSKRTGLDRARLHEQGRQRLGVRQPPPPAPQAGRGGGQRPWAGFHAFRHTFASLHLSRGTNLLQLSRALGHHSAAFTLSRYTHLLPGDEAPPLDLGGPVAATSGESGICRETGVVPAGPVGSFASVRKAVDSGI